ncbi:copper transporter 2-like [Asparagus officinalis]|nr:copper transporter 2-like [Asparagus officinalis]
MYVLALIAVFLLAVLYEWCNHCRLIKRASRSPNVAVGLARTALHAIRVGLMYLTMLAVMSFNVGVLIVVILGHAVGFLLFGSAAVNESDVNGVTGEKRPDLPPVGC